MAGQQHGPLLQDADFDKLHDQLSETAGREARGKIAIQLNDMVANSPAYIGLVHRGRVSAKANSLGGVRINPWDSELWNVADWFRQQVARAAGPRTPRPGPARGRGEAPCSTTRSGGCSSRSRRCW